MKSKPWIAGIAALSMMASCLPSFAQDASQILVDPALEIIEQADIEPVSESPDLWQEADPAPESDVLSDLPEDVWDPDTLLIEDFYDTQVMEEVTESAGDLQIIEDVIEGDDLIIEEALEDASEEAPLLSEAASALQPGDTQITFGPDEREKVFSFTFPDSSAAMLRYSLTTSDPNAEIQCTHFQGSTGGTGHCEVVDSPGSVHEVRIYKSAENQTGVTLQIRHMDIISVTALNTPEIDIHVLGSYYWDAIKVRITYSDGSFEDRDFIAFYQHGFSIDGQWYSDSACLNRINNPESYDGIAYTKIIPDFNPAWAFAASFKLVPYDENRYPLISADGTTYTLSGGERQKLYRFKVEKTGVYQTVGRNARCEIVAAGESWSGYNPHLNLGFGGQILEAGLECMVRVTLQNDEYGNPHSSGTFKCYMQPFLQSIALEIDQSSKITWDNWGTRIRKVFTYLDPKDDLVKTFKAPITEPLPEDNKYVFGSEMRMEQVPGSPDYWNLSLIEPYQRDSAGKGSWDPAYNPAKCSAVIPIYNVDIADNVGVTVGADTGQYVNSSLDAIKNNIPGAAATAGTAEKIQKAAESVEQMSHVSANMEIQQSSNSGEIGLAQNKAGSSSKIIQSVDVSVIVRENATALGNISEMPNEVAFSVKVADYDPNKDYSIIRVHDGRAEKLTIFRVEPEGKGARLWFKSNKFSTFALAETPQRITVSKKPVIKKPVVGGKTKATVTWNKFKQTKATKKIWKKVKKIEVQYSTDKKFRKNVRKKTLAKTKTKIVLNGLKKNTTYYVRIRYKGTGGYSKWSTVKKFRTRKK